MIQDADRDEMLANEEFVTSLLKARKTSESKPWWDSQGLWASFGALAVSLVTLIGTYLLQGRQRIQDLAMARQDFELKQNREFLAATAAMVGRVLTAVEDQLWLAEGHLDVSPLERKKVVDQVNAADKEWRDGEGSTAFYFRLYYGRNEALQTAWRSARGSISAAWACAERNYLEHLRTKAEPGACAGELAIAREKWESVALVLAESYTERVGVMDSGKSDRGSGR